MTDIATTAAPARPDRVKDWCVTICDACRTASCWHGEFMCERSQHAGTTEAWASQLDVEHREHRSNYSLTKLRAVTGSEPERGEHSR